MNSVTLCFALVVGVTAVIPKQAKVDCETVYGGFKAPLTELTRFMQFTDTLAAPSFSAVKFPHSQLPGLFSSVLQGSALTYEYTRAATTCSGALASFMFWQTQKLQTVAALNSTLYDLWKPQSYKPLSPEDKLLFDKTLPLVIKLLNGTTEDQQVFSALHACRGALSSLAAAIPANNIGYLVWHYNEEEETARKLHNTTGEAFWRAAKASAEKVQTILVNTWGKTPLNLVSLCTNAMFAYVNSFGFERSGLQTALENIKSAQAATGSVRRLYLTTAYETLLGFNVDVMEQSVAKRLICGQLQHW